MDATSFVSRASQIISSYPTKDLSPKDSIDLDDLFGFNDIWQNAVKVEQTVDALYVPNRIFINHIDTFNGKYLSQFLLKKTFGTKLDGEDEGEEGEEEDNEEEDKSVKKEPNSKVVNEIRESNVRSTNSNEEKISDAVPGEVIDGNGFREGGDANDDIEINMLEELSKKYKDNIFYELYDFSQLTVQDYYELTELESETEQKMYLRQKLKKEDKSDELVKESHHTIEENLNQNNGSRAKMKFPATTFEIFGTCKNHDSIIPENITIITSTDDRSTFLSQLMKCGAVIYDITRSLDQIKEATWALNAILTKLTEQETENPKEFKETNDIRYFVLISSLMTWALTKPIDPDDPDLPFMEEDYRRRKAHPNYKLHIALEREVLAAGKKFKHQFKTAVIACGVPYGFEEDMLHYLFKMGWQNAEKLPIFGRGRNIIPLIHIEDLAAIIYEIISNFPPVKTRYIFAKEPTNSSLRDIVKAVSGALTTGKTDKLTKEDAFLLDGEISQDVYDIMTTNLNMETAFVDDLNINWKDEFGFVESINKFIKEYKEARNLIPVRIFLQGPVGSRKSMLAKRLCEYYKLQHLTIDTVTNNHIQSLKDKIQKMKNKEEANLKDEELAEEKFNKPEVDAEGEDEENEEEEVEEEEQNEESYEELVEQLKDIKENMDINFEKLDDEHLTRIFKETLLSKSCQNQGFVLDGYPQTKSQAQALFGMELDEEELEEEEESEEQPYNKSLMPDYIFSLDASDKMLFETALNFGREDSLGKQYTETDVIQEISFYRKLGDNMENSLEYFHELDILPIGIDIESDKTPMMDKIFGEIISSIGTPKNYDQFKIETSEDKQLREQTEKNNMLELQKKNEEEKNVLNISRRRQMEKWASMVDLFKVEEEKMLAVKSMTVRNYLIREIFPTLTAGLIEVAKIKPVDPVDYLAEYLFKVNPSGRMFQPEYTEEGQEHTLYMKKHGKLLNIDSKVHLV